MTQTEKTLAHYAVMRSLERSPQTFKQLLESCHSLFPDQLASLLGEMETDHFVWRDGEEYALDGSILNRWRRLYADWNENLDRAYTSLSAIMGRIHLPHCLDYEWWFTHSGREKVAELLLHNNPLPTPESVVFLGSPLFGAFASALLPESKIYILDKSDATLETIKKDVDSERVHLIHYDAEESLPQELVGSADMVFFDPPWYVDYYDIFLRRSMQLSYGRYATVAFVLFPLLTRPASLQERKRVFEIAMSYGLSLVSMETHIAPDLLVFADGHVALPTVSRRDPIRKEIDLWTSTQRGFKIKGWRAIWKIVEGIRDNLSFEEIFESIRREYPNATIPELEKPAVEVVWRELQSHLGG